MPDSIAFAAARSRRAHRLGLLLVLLLAAAIRLAHWAAVRDQPFFAQLAMDSQEYDRWAREIAAGDWIGERPFFQAPLYPYLVAILYRFVAATPDAVYLFQILLSVAGLAALAAATDRMLGPPHGVVAAALGAFAGPLVFHDVQLLKESAAVAVVGFLLLALAAAREHGGGWAWPGAGALLGLLVLLRENALLLAPLLALLAIRRGDRWRSALRAAGFLLGVALPLAPVAARNAALGGGFLPTTFQGGVNFWIGNHPGADGTYSPITPGRQIPAQERAEPRRIAESETGRALTGAEVSSFWLRRSLSWARAEPLAFLRLQLRKLGLFFSFYEWPDAVDYYWTKRISAPLRFAFVEFGALALLAAAGVVIARDRIGALAPALLLEIGWLVSTVAFFLFSRYRLPALPGLLVLGSVPLVAWARRARSASRPVTAIGAVALAATFAAPHLAGFAPRRDLVEFNLGRLAQEAGDPAAAERHYAAALDADPDAFLAAMNLGTLAARRGDLPRALTLLGRAAEIEPDSPDAHANLGAALLAARELDAARAELETALALDPSHPQARSNLALLERRATAPDGAP